MTAAEALQTTLAAEHAAIYVLGVLGAQTSQSASPGLFVAVTDSYAAHRARRDFLVRTIIDLGAEPVAPDASYDVPADLGRPEVVTAEALRLERACAATYAFLVGSTTQALRLWALRALEDSAVRALAVGGAPEDLPGT